MGVVDAQDSGSKENSDRRSEKIEENIAAD